MRFTFDPLCIVLLCAMIGVIVGGRLGYVLFYNFEMYAANPLAIFDFSRGGMSFHGGFVGAVIAGVILFVLLFALSRKLPPFSRGTYTGVFMIGYGICRFMVEFIREPDVQLGYLWGGWLTMGQVLSVPLILIGIGLLIYAYKTKHPQKGPQYDFDE